MDILKTKSQKALDEEIIRLTESLSTISTTEEYDNTVSNIKILCEAREKKDPASISTEMLIAVGANLLGLLVILNFERTGVVTSKALGFLWKNK